MEIKDLLKTMLVFFQDIDKRLEKLSKELSIADTKQQELLHYIENHNLNAVDSCKIIKLLKTVREERREIKNEINVVQSLKDTFVDKYKNKFIEKDLIQALKNLKELSEKQNNPSYTYKFLTKDLEVKDER